MDNNRVVMRAATQRRSIQHVRARSESADFPAIMRFGATHES